ncbi:MAG: tetratricopeptide repeat protein [Cyanothece sp. SIO1E1]|nr:tetratricopeptide repeat protein [Cyanothece sp. SIO1E1]
MTGAVESPMVDAERLEKALSQYETELAQLPIFSEDKTELSTRQLSTEEVEALEPKIMGILKARDCIQMLLDSASDSMGQEASLISADLWLQLALLDEAFLKHKNLVASYPKLETWRKSFDPPESAWWWHLEKPADPRDRLDWLWNSLTIAALTGNLALVTDIASRFLTGVPGVWSAFAAITPGILTLFASGGALTKVGQQTIEKLLLHLKFTKYRWSEAKLVFSGGLLLSLVAFHTALPAVAILYNHTGKNLYDDGKLSSAQANFERALSLYPDYPEAHFWLGLIQEDLQQPEAAEESYRKALQAGYLPAYNNLSLLYIVQGEPDKAMQLLNRALFSFDQKQEDPELGYALHKNIGWARLEQARYPEAEVYLKKAIELKGDRADAYCLMGKLLEQQQEPEAALDYWNNCLNYANVYTDDLFIDEASDRLDIQGVN